MPSAADTRATPPLRRVALAGMPERSVEYAIRRRRGSRNIRLYVGDDGAVTVSAPPRVALRDLDQMIVDRSDWLRTTVDAATASADRTRVDLHAGSSVPFRGDPLPVRIAAGPTRRSQLAVDHGSGRPLLELTVPSGADPFPQLVDWYRSVAREAFTDRVAFWSARFGLAAGRISVRDQRTRWGSCTARGDLSFNWRLILAPAWVLDAIVVHELCHIDQLDHSRAFWSLLDARYPEHRAASAWLRAHGRELQVRPAATTSQVSPPARAAAAAIEETPRQLSGDAPKNLTLF